MQRNLPEITTVLTIVTITCQGHVKMRVDLTGARSWQRVPVDVRNGVFSVPRMCQLKPERFKVKTKFLCISFLMWLHNPRADFARKALRSS